MDDEVYTLGAWRVRDGQQAAFVEQWQQLGRFFGGLPDPPGQGTLLQSVDDPQQFYSFGPWPSLAAVERMRSHPDTPGRIRQLMALCEQGSPGTYRVVATG